MDETFGFIIPTCVRERCHLESLKRCINSIRKHYPDILIVLIIDFTSDIDLSSDKLYDTDTNIIREYTSEKIPADMLVYKYFLKNKYFDKAIVIQDSMVLLNKFSNLDFIDTFKYIWHFTNHRKHWHIIKEPKTSYNEENNIITHDDLIKDCINKFITKPDLKKYMLEIYDQKNKWSGCFGCLTIMTHSFLKMFDEETDIIAIMGKMTNNRMRRAIESIFPLSCQYVCNTEIHESYDGLYYDGNGSSRMKTDLLEKISYDRQ